MSCPGPEDPVAGADTAVGAGGDIAAATGSGTGVAEGSGTGVGADSGVGTAVGSVVGAGDGVGVTSKEATVTEPAWGVSVKSWIALLGTGVGFNLAR